MCNFKPFKAEVYDVKFLAESTKSSCSINAIGINRNISNKESLDEAVRVRNGGLRVQYLEN